MSYQREFKRKISIGVLGLGSHCYRNILPALTFLPVSIEAFCDRNEELLHQTAAQYGVKQCYSDAAAMYADAELDAVIICVSPFAHAKLTCEALATGLHVWLEKPPAARALEIDKMISRRGNRVVVVGFKKAFMPAVRKAKELLTAPEAGQLKSILSEYRIAIPENGKAILESGQMSDWLGNGCHPISVMHAIGGPVAQVTTIRSKHQGGVCVLEFTSGAVGTLHLAAGMRGPCERYSFFADKAHVVIENSSRVALHRGIPFIYDKTTNFAPPGIDSGTIIWEPQNGLATLENKALFTQGIYDELRHFTDAVLNNQPAKIGTLEDAREIMRIYEAALLSDGMPVAI